MRLSLYVSPRSRAPEHQRPLMDLIVEQALIADAAGFDGIFFTEHHLSTHNPFQNSLLFASYLAPQIKQAYLGLSTVSPTIHQPVRLVECLNLLDQFQQGRLVVGLGAGNATEFPIFGRDVAIRGRLFDESLDVMLKLWAFQDGDEPFAFETPVERGRVDKPVNPEPFRKPHPILAHATQSGSTMALAGRRGWPIFLGAWTPEETAPHLAVYRAALAEADHGSETLATAWRWTGLMKWVHVAETDEQADREFDETVLRLVDEMAGEHKPARQREHVAPEAQSDPRYRRMQDPAVIKGLFGLTGSPETVVRKLRAYADLGVGQIMCQVLRDVDEAEASRRSFRLLIDEVLPHFQSENAPNGVDAAPVLAGAAPR